MKVNENTFWKFLIACFRTNNKELMNKILKQNKKELEKVSTIKEETIKNPPS